MTDITLFKNIQKYLMVIYGHTICCHDFRMRETKFLEKLMEEFKNEKYNMRIVVSHVPFHLTEFRKNVLS